MIPLMRLDSFTKTKIGTEGGKSQKYVRLIKMDTEGSEIDILRSGLGLFENKQVHSFVVELGVRHWVENKGVSDFTFVCWKFNQVLFHTILYAVSLSLKKDFVTQVVSSKEREGQSAMM